MVCDQSICATTCGPHGLIIPKLQMSLPRMLLSHHCFTAFPPAPGVGTPYLKRYPWCQHPLLQNLHLLPGLVLPTTFPRICFFISPHHSQSTWFLWSWCFLGRGVERKEGVYKNNEIELCLKMFRITHL